MVDDGETVDFSDADDVFGACHDLSSSIFLDELLKGTHACTHTHTCNPPGPSATPHTHTCVHTHTHLFSQDQVTEEQTVNATDFSKAASSSLKKTPLGNKEAVKRYREKKKAHAAHLEEQVAQLRLLNQQLVRRLQGQASLEAEVYRLRSLLAEFRGRIDGELGVFLHQKGPSPMPKSAGGYVCNTYSVPCGGDDLPCLHPSLERDNISANVHDAAAPEWPAFPCEEEVTRCGKKQATRKTISGKRANARDAKVAVGAD